jgi:hypothetical protein
MLAYQVVEQVLPARTSGQPLQNIFSAKISDTLNGPILSCEGR